MTMFHTDCFFRLYVFSVLIALLNYSHDVFWIAVPLEGDVGIDRRHTVWAIDRTCVTSTVRALWLPSDITTRDQIVEEEEDWEAMNRNSSPL